MGRPFEKEVKPMAVGSLKSVWELNRLDYPRRSCPPRGIQSHTYAGRPHNQPVWAPTDTNSRPMDVDYRPKAMYPPRKLLPLTGHPVLSTFVLNSKYHLRQLNPLPFREFASQILKFQNLFRRKTLSTVHMLFSLSTPRSSNSSERRWLGNIMP